MPKKIRLPRKATKGKGKLWKKGHSCSFNPDIRKFRDEAKKQALYGYQGSGNLTKDALARLDALHGDRSVDSIVGDDTTSVGDKTFVTTFSDCSNPAFSRLLKNWQSRSLLHKEMLAVLAAVTEVIKSQGGKETETEYFAALMTTLSAVDTDEAITAVASLLHMVVKRLPVAVRRLKFSDSCKVFVELLSKYMNSDFNALLRNLLGCLHFFLKAQEAAEWTDSTSKIYSVLLEFATHQKPKVRKAAHEAIVSILCGSAPNKETVTVCHPAALSTAQFCTEKLEVSGGDASPLTFHVLGLLKDVIGAFPKSSVKSCCETVLRVMTLSNVMVTSVCLKVFFGLFNSRIRSDNLPAELNAKLVSALYDYQPNINDEMPLIDWLCVMEKALCNLYRCDEKLCISHLPNFFNAAVKCWTSHQSAVRFAVAESLKNVLICCIEPSKPEFQRVLLADPIDNPMSKMFHAVEGALSYQYHLAWKEVLLVLSVFFDVAGKHLYPVMMKCLQSLADLRDAFRFSHIAELDKAVGMALHRMGPKVVMKAIPLLITGENDGMDFPRSWLLPLLRDNVKDTELAFFTKYFLPLAVKIKNRVQQAEKQDKIIESKTYTVIWTQIWSILPGFCTNPTDLKESFSGIAKILGTALSEDKDLRPYILSALRLLITNNLDNEENKKEIAGFAKNYLPILFNLYTTEAKDKFEERHRLAVYDTLKAYLQITDKMQCIAFFNRAMEKLNAPDLEVFMHHSLIDIGRAMLSYVDAEHIEKLYEYCQPLLKHTNHTIQKKSYSVLKELCSSESENCVVFVKKNLEKLKTLLLTSLSVSSPSSKALRLICIGHIIHQLTEDEENKNFVTSVVPEAVLCTKENSMKARTAAFSLIVQIGHKMKQWNPDDTKGTLRDYMQMLLAGLAGSPHLISATILAIGQVVFEFKDELDSDLINLLIENMCLLLSSRSREIVDSALSFIKILFASMDTMQLGPHVQNLVQNIVSISEDNQRHFRFKAKEIFTRLIRKFGYELISGMVPANYQKQLTNIRKTESRKARKREMKNIYEESDDDMPKHKGKSDLIEDLLEDSDEELSKESTVKTSKKVSKHPKKHVNAPWIEEQDENDIVDFLDPAVSRKILATKPKPHNVEDKPKSSTSFPIAPDGRLIIKEEEGEVKSNKKRKAADEHDILFDEVPSEHKLKKRKVEDLSDDECNISSGYQPGGKGIHRNLCKNSSNELRGTEYKAKKAGGDLKKGKYDPFAYFPLNKQTLNKRKRGKLSGQFKGVVRAAKRGAQKGTKTKARNTRRKK